MGVVDVGGRETAEWEGRLRSGKGKRTLPPLRTSVSEAISQGEGCVRAMCML